jgi:hypothetical protein
VFQFGVVLRAGNLIVMHRLRLLVAVLAIFTVLGVGPAFAQSTDGPAVVVQEDAALPAEEAWTFRFLIPALMGATALAVAGVVIGYGVRVRGRYRVVE